MARTFWLRAAAPLCALALIASACGDDDGDDAGATPETTAGDGATATTTGGDDGPSLLWDNGACDESLETYRVGMITTFESPVLSLVDQVTAGEASVEAFNARGGIGGHCMEFVSCDAAGDPNQEVDCARQFVDEGVVATVNDTTAINPQGVQDVMEPAGLPRVGIYPSNTEMASPISYGFGAGGAGAAFMTIPPLAREGITKIAMIHVDTPLAGALMGVLGDGMLAAYGAEFVYASPVPAGTTDFQQFVLAAEDAGAEAAVLALGENEGLQILQAAQQLGTDMRFSLNLGSYGQADVAAFGDFADQLVFSAELPPITADTDIWPILDEAIADLEASGDPELQRDQIKSSSFRSWVAVYALVSVVEEFGTPDDVSREAITAAFEAAQDVDMFGLIPPWTPTAGPGEGLFSRVSQPWYYVADFDADEGNFVVRDEQYNVVDEFAGEIDYAPNPVGG